MKRCPKCGGEVPEWRVLRYCRVCAAAMARERRKRDPEKVRASDRKRYGRLTPEQHERRREAGREYARRKRAERASGRTCEECGGPIPIEAVIGRKTCSAECRRQRDNRYAREWARKKYDHSAVGSDESSRRRSEMMKARWAAGGHVYKSRRCRCCEETFTPKSAGDRYCSGECKRFRELSKRYGVDCKILRARYLEQDGKCAICGSGARGWGRSLALVIDHCHDTGAVRGFLCAVCNTALGAFGDDPQRLRAAVAYLEATTCLSADTSRSTRTGCVTSAVTSGA